MFMQVIVIEINAFCKGFSHQLSFIYFFFLEGGGGGSEGIRFNNEIIMCYYVRYMLKYALKSAVKH